jgi:AsmA protein
MTAAEEAATHMRAEAARLERPWLRPLIILTLAVVVAGAAHIWPRLASRTFLASVIERDVCPEIGVSCRVVGPVHLSLLPYPAIEAKGLIVSAGDGQAELTAALAIAELRALPLLVGRLSVNHLDLSGARIELTAPRAEMRLLASADGAGAAMLDGMVSAARIRHRLTWVTISRSRLIVHADASPNLVIDDISGGLSWPQGGGPFSVRLAGTTGSEPVALNLEGPVFSDLGKSEGSHVSIDAALGDNSVSFVGRLVKPKDLVAAGMLEATLPSAKRIANLLSAQGWPVWLPDAPIRVDGPVFIAGRGVDFDNADFEVGPSRFTGVLSLRSTADGRPALMGTLAAALVDAGDVGLVPGSSFAFPDLARLPDFDLRLSIRRLIAKGVSFNAVAAGLILADGRLDLTLSQGLARQSNGKLRLVATAEDEGLSLRTQATGENIDVGAIMSALSSRPALSGTGAFMLNLEGRGGEVATLVRSLSGKASLLMKAGFLSLDTEGTPVASLGADDGTAPMTARHFSEASFAGTAEHGVLTLTEGRIGSGASQILIDGNIDVGDRGLDLSLRGTEGAKPDSAWHLRAVGPWSAPNIWRQSATE